MSTTLLNGLQLKGFLSFGPDSEPVELTGLNLLIGPNGVGKSNFIEALELLHATPADFSEAIRLGGLPNDWVWHGKKKAKVARIEQLTQKTFATDRDFVPKGMVEVVPRALKTSINGKSRDRNCGSWKASTP